LHPSRMACPALWLRRRRHVADRGEGTRPTGRETTVFTEEGRKTSNETTSMDVPKSKVAEKKRGSHQVRKEKNQEEMEEKGGNCIPPADRGKEGGNYLADDIVNGKSQKRDAAKKWKPAMGGNAPKRP